MTSMTLKTLRLDNKGRVSLGSLIEEGVSSFRAYIDNEHRIVLEPYVEVPAREAWLHKNSKQLNSVKKGLKESAQGKTKSLGSFSKHLDK